MTASVSHPLTFSKPSTSWTFAAGKVCPVLKLVEKRVPIVHETGTFPQPATDFRWAMVRPWNDRGTTRSSRVATGRSALGGGLARIGAGGLRCGDGGGTAHACLGEALRLVRGDLDDLVRLVALVGPAQLEVHGVAHRFCSFIFPPRAWRAARAPLRIGARAGVCSAPDSSMCQNGLAT